MVVGAVPRTLLMVNYIISKIQQKCKQNQITKKLFYILFVFDNEYLLYLFCQTKENNMRIAFDIDDTLAQYTARLITLSRQPKKPATFTAWLFRKHFLSCGQFMQVFNWQNFEKGWGRNLLRALK